MTDEPTDLYQELLDLPFGARPPHHYDLLRLELFCSHRERITQAARKQFRLVKPYQNHPERVTREAVQDLLNRIATARVVLTDAKLKEAYDLQLAAELAVDRDVILAERVAAPLPEFELLVTAGPSQVGQTVELVEETSVLLGSDLGCVVPLGPARALPRHGEIRFVEGEWEIRPADPAGLVQINDAAVEAFVLADGDRIDVGGYRLVFRRIPRGGDSKPGMAKQAPPLSLIVQRGPAAPAPVFNALAPQRFLIGHGETALWQLPDRWVSRHHCAIQSAGDRWELEDLGSTHGTKVNGVEVLRDLLNDRDVVTIGRFDVLVSLRV